MSDRIRQYLSTVIVALVVGALAGVTSSALAQEPEAKPTTDGPHTAQVFETAGLNADRVDNRHAVAYTTKRSKRAGKLVATNANGYLPSNILKPQWNVIQNKPASFTDGQIGWYEVANKPGGFADNVDDAGVTGIKLGYHTAMKSTSGMAVGDIIRVDATCPSGKLTGGGAGQNRYGFHVLDTRPWSSTKWTVFYEKVGTSTGNLSSELYAYAFCLTTTPSAALSSKDDAKIATKRK